VFKGLTHLVLR